MKTKHTPGPWALFNGADIYPDNDDKRARHHIAEVSPEGYSTEECDITSDEHKANARLIAAAPDLFDACNRTPNPIGTGTMSNCHILLMAVVALRNEGHMTLANELEAIQQHQKVAIAKATQP